MNQPQEGAESILDHTKPTEPVNLTFWQTCKAHPWPAAAALLVVLGLVAALFSACTPKNPPAAAKALVQATTQAEPEQTTEAKIQPRMTPKKIALKATNTPASGANLPASDEALSEFITQLEQEQAHVATEAAVPAPSASYFEQDLSLKSPSRPFPPFPPFPLN